MTDLELLVIARMLSSRRRLRLLVVALWSFVVGSVIGLWSRTLVVADAWWSLSFYQAPP